VLYRMSCRGNRSRSARVLRIGRVKSAVRSPGMGGAGRAGGSLGLVNGSGVGRAGSPLRAIV